MKKFIIALLAAVFAVVTAFSALPVLAASGSFSLSGASTVRAGDTITVAVVFSGSGVTGATGDITFDSSKLSFVSSSQSIASPWAVEFNPSAETVKFVAYDNQLTSPINGSKELFKLTFKVGSLSDGMSFAVTASNLKVTDGSQDTSCGSASYSKAVSPPLSSNTRLSSLTVSNVAISPAFNPDTVNYTASVAFDISKLTLSATAEDAKSSVSIGNTSLTAGGTTTVSVVVTSESGAKKTYSIKVTRAADPNYVKSGNNSLKNITVEGFLLSPVFDTAVTEYIVWLPYETTDVKISGTPADSKAHVEVEGGTGLAAGKGNTAKVICIAENGSKKEYTVILKRATAHGEEDVVVNDISSTISVPYQSNQSDTSLWLILLIALISAGFGSGATFAVLKVKAKK